MILYNSGTQTGSEIPYLSLTLHAIQRDGDKIGVYTQITLSPDAFATSNHDAYDDDELIELTIITSESGDVGIQDGAQALYNAMSTCAGLHADPDQESGDEEMGEGPQILLRGGEIEEMEPVEGQSLEGFLQGGGWVTADNVHMFQDPDDAGEPTSAGLGPGAGTVRAREDDGEEVQGENEESKWRRTD